MFRPCCKTPSTPPVCSSCPPMCCSPGISNCIFDLESAVFDTRHMYRRALQHLVRSYGKKIPDHVLIQTRPMESAEMAEFICRKCKLPVAWDMFLFQLNQHICKLIAHPPLMPGVRRLVTHLRKCCMGLGLVTSCSQALYCSKIRGREEFFENFCTVLCADDAELRARKPEPDVYLIAVDRLGDAERECTLVFDGTPKGVQAARDARLPVVMLAERELPCCWSELATLRLETLRQFKPEEFDMPAYSRTEPPESHIAWRPSHRGSRKSHDYRSSLITQGDGTEITSPASEEAAVKQDEPEEAKPVKRQTKLTSFVADIFKR